MLSCDAAGIRAEIQIHIPDLQLLCTRIILFLCPKMLLCYLFLRVLVRLFVWVQQVWISPRAAHTVSPLSYRFIPTREKKKIYG